jgi:hypothetical protein
MKFIISESRMNQIIDNYLDMVINNLYATVSNHGGHGRLDLEDKEGNSLVVIFFNRYKQEMEVMMDVSLYSEIYHMFSMKEFDDIQQHLIRWFKDNYDGLDHITEVTTYDKEDYAF